MFILFFGERLDGGVDDRFRRDRRAARGIDALHALLLEDRRAGFADGGIVLLLVVLRHLRDLASGNGSPKVARETKGDRPPRRQYRTRETEIPSLPSPPAIPENEAEGDEFPVNLL